MASVNAPGTPNERLSRKISADADTVAPRQSDMMLPVMVMNVMPTAAQPMKEIALSSALMLSGEVNPGVASAKAAIAAPAMRRTARTRWRGRPPNGPSLAATFGAERVMALSGVQQAP